MTSLLSNYDLKYAPKISSKVRRVWGVFFSSYTQIILLWRPRCSMISNNTCSIKWTPLDVYIASSEIQDGHSFLKAKNGKFVGIRSKVVIHPTISLLITNWCPDSISLVDYYKKSLLIGTGIFLVCFHIRGHWIESCLVDSGISPQVTIQSRSFPWILHLNLQEGDGIDY